MTLFLSGTYAHISHRDWENDAEVTKAGFDAETCDDIAEQLILSDPGKNINVSLAQCIDIFSDLNICEFKLIFVYLMRTR